MAQVSHSTSHCHIATAFHFFRENGGPLWPLVLGFPPLASFFCMSSLTEFIGRETLWHKGEPPRGFDLRWPKSSLGTQAFPVYACAKLFKWAWTTLKTGKACSKHHVRVGHYPRTIIFTYRPKLHGMLYR